MLSLLAPAKVNLFLHVLGRREDGFHELQSLTFFCDIGDEITAAPQDNGNSTLTITGPFGDGLPNDNSNLILRGYHALQRAYPQLPHLHITLNKQLPVAAGLGGGSSDVAALLRGAVEHYQQQISFDAEKIQQILQSLGSDCPVCYTAKPALMEGTGHKITPWPELPDFGILLVNPKLPLSTAAVYGNCKKYRPSQSFTPPEHPHGWLELAESTYNDLEAPAITALPVIQAILDTLTNQPEIRFSRMSGSGASCFALCDSRKSAAKAATRLAATHPDWWVRAGGALHG